MSEPTRPDAGSAVAPAPTPAQRLWQLWRRGQRPDVRDFLAGAGDLPAGQVAAALLVDQRERWRAGERVPAEAYLGLYPRRRGDFEFGLELVYGEFLLREQCGETPDLEDYARRFPAYAERLKLQVELHRAIKAVPGAPSLSSDGGRPQETVVDASGGEVLPWPMIPGYEIVAELGRGGMGAVLRAHDPELGRDLAVKVILDRHGHDPQFVRRFLGEARTVARLQHPGIAPVHELGTLPDGRPYFAMKLVEGRTLADLLRERKSPADDLPRFLGVFEQVCQAVAHAHSKGVLHRDLKPANVMVGAFGEVQVMDWGLAKVLQKDEGGRRKDEKDTATGDDSSFILPPSSFSEGTQPGTAMGTPAYMTPEQARGEVESLDARCDVFGLGAVLCEILTGRPPYERVEQAPRGDTADALRRLAECGADAELLELDRRCLSVERDGRPADAGAVAAAVAAYRAGVQERLRSAERERAAAEVRAAEERRRRRLALALTASVLLTAGLAAGGALWLRTQRLERQAEQARRDEQETRDEAALTRAVEEDLREAADHRRDRKWAEARAAVARADGRLGEAGREPLRARVRQAQRELAQVQKDQRMAEWLEDARATAAGADADGNFDRTGADRAYREAFAWYGLGVEALDPEEAAARIRDSSIREQLVTALDHWSFIKLALVTGGRKGRPVRGLSDLAGLDPAALEKAAGPLLAVASRADANRWRRQLREAFAALDWEAVRRLTDGSEAADLPPATLELVARVLELLGLRDKSLKILQEAQQRHRGDFWINFELARAYSDARPARPEDAACYLTAALALRPHSPVVHNVLGNARFAQGKWAEAAAAYREAVRLQPDYAMAHHNLGRVLQKEGKPADAADALREAVRLRPDEPRYHVNLSAALLRQNKLDEAEAACRTALQGDPELAAAYLNLGTTLSRKGKYAEGEAAYREALRRERGSATIWYNLGITLELREKPDEARDAFREAVRLDPGLAEAQYHLGSLLWKKQDLDAAAAAFRAALKADPRHAGAHHNLGVILRQQGKLDEAIAEYRAALRITPAVAGTHVALGNALRQQGKLEEAAAAYREAVRLDSKNGLAHFGLAGVLLEHKQFADALAALKRARELLPPTDPRQTEIRDAIREAEKSLPDNR